ncbi:MAG: SCO family protein, partial [Pirellulales bacterium]
ELTTSKGEKVRFYDDLIKDKVVAVNFIYTSCGEMCPVETARLKTVSQILGDT